MPTPPLFRRTTPSVPIRAVHLDLKGLPPTPLRLLQLLEIFAGARFNGVLVEWEDAFPWDVDPRFRSETAYTPDEIETFHRRAANLGLNVIPLVQSLGHMEMVLAIDDYRALREAPDRCDSLNPLADGARPLVQRMVDDVLRRSGPITHFHLGGDESFTFGSHPQAREFIERHGKAALYLHHVEPLLDALLARGVRPILWHDMMHDWDHTSLARLRGKADVMFWSYQGHPDAAPPLYNTKLLERFINAGVSVWGAAAFKGADGRGDAELPDLQRRIDNALGWSDVAARHPLVGVVATGWSRYSTHRVQCEPIDGALDALLGVAAVLHDGEAPLNGAVVDMLDSLGEAERFRACRDALSDLSEARRRAWDAVLHHRQQRCLEASDPRRRGSGVLDEFERIANEQIASAHVAGANVRSALAGLVPELWVERFVQERLLPLHTRGEVCPSAMSPRPMWKGT